MSLTLGVARTYDVAAALVRDGELLVVAEAERVLDLKHARGPECLPPAVLAACAQAGVTLADVEHVVIADTGRDRLEEHHGLAHRPSLVAPLGTVVDTAALPLGPLNIPGLRSTTTAGYVCHHAAHAAAAVYLIGFDECVALVVDGYGVCCGTMAYLYRDGRLQRLDAFRDAALLGWRYQLFGHLTREICPDRTDILDLAGKVMGLNAYGTPRERAVRYFEEFFRGDFADYKTCWQPEKRWFADLPGFNGIGRGEGSVHSPQSLDLVASMQEAFSRVLEDLVRRVMAHTGVKRLALTGGCALNVLANSRSAC